MLSAIASGIGGNHREGIGGLALKVRVANQGDNTGSAIDREGFAITSGRFDAVADTTGDIRGVVTGCGVNDLRCS